jgi:hypothetical protein
VIREDVGTGKDYKQAATDAFKRAAVRFGIAHELYAYEQNWVQMDGDGKYAKPVEDPGVAYARRYGGQPAHEAEPEGARLQVPRPQLRRRDLAPEAAAAGQAGTRVGAGSPPRPAAHGRGLPHG